MNSLPQSEQTRGASNKEVIAGPALWSMRPRAIWRAFRAEHFAVGCICIYLILEYLKLEQSYFIFGILPLLRFAVLGAILGYAVDKQSKFTRSSLNWLIVFFLIQCAISASLAYDSSYSFSKFDIIFTWVVIYFLITGIINSERRLFLFFVAYFLANFKMSQFGFFSWVGRGFGFASWGITGAGWFRNSGELGLEMSLFFAYTIFYVVFLRKYWTGWVKWLMYFLPISALACVIASSSRGAIVGCVGILFYLSFFSKQRLRAWSLTALTLFIGYLVLPAQFLARFQAAGTDATSLSRIAYWAKARVMMADHPYFGVGYYNWIPYYKNHYFDPSLYWRVEEAHNTYLQMGAELGYIGLGIFVTMVLISFYVNARSARLARREGFEYLRCIALAMNAAGVGLIIGSIFLTAFFLPNYWIHFALTVSLSAAIKNKLLAMPAETRAGAKLPPGR